MLSFSMKGTGVVGANPKLPVSKVTKPGQIVLLKSPVSPSPCPVAIADALAVVNVGNTAWLFAKCTPLVRMAQSAGVSCSLTDPYRSPSATKRITFRCPLAASWCPATPVTSAASKMSPLLGKDTNRWSRRQTRMSRISWDSSPSWRAGPQYAAGTYGSLAHDAADGRDDGRILQVEPGLLEHRDGPLAFGLRCLGPRALHGFLLGLRLRELELGLGLLETRPGLRHRLLGAGGGRPRRLDGGGRGLLAIHGLGVLLLGNLVLGRQRRIPGHIVLSLEVVGFGLP